MSLSPFARGAPRLAGPVIFATAAMSMIALQAPEARGADDKTSCVASYGSSQELRRDQHLGRAREELRSCARAACPALVRGDCVAWLDQVQAEFPTLAIRAVKDGADVANVKVMVDNEVIASRLDGSSLEIEPGEHTLRFETEGAPPVFVKLVAREHEKDRLIPVSFVSAPGPGGQQGAGPEQAQPLSRTVPVGSLVLGGMGVAGLVTFGVLGWVGKNRESSLETTCKPNCSQTAIGNVRTEYIVADVALGVGAAALVSAGIWYLVHPRRAREVPASPGGVTVAPGRDGAVLEWNGIF
jgi:hypothetical protein